MLHKLSFLQFASLPSTIDEVAFTSSTLCALVDGQVFVHLAGNSSITMATGRLACKYMVYL